MMRCLEKETINNGLITMQISNGHQNKTIKELSHFKKGFDKGSQGNVNQVIMFGFIDDVWLC